MKLLRQLTEWYVNYPFQVAAQVSNEQLKDEAIDSFVSSVMQSTDLDYKEIESFNGRNYRAVVIGFRDLDDAHKGAAHLKKAQMEKDNFPDIHLSTMDASKSYNLSEATYAFQGAEEISFDQLRSMGEGLVLLGAGGDLSDWINGVSGMLHEEGIAGSAKPADLWGGAYALTTTGGRTDLVLTFKEDSPLDIGKLAMWRLNFGDASWISDYIENYSSQHD
jgi:hypothetical protein